MDANAHQLGRLPKETYSNKIPVVNSILLPRSSQVQVLVQASASELSFLQCSPHLSKAQQSIMSNVAIEFVPLVYFRVVVGNLKESALRLHEVSVVRLVLPAPTRLAPLPSKKNYAARRPVTTVELDNLTDTR